MKLSSNFDKPPLFHSASRPGNEACKTVNFNSLPNMFGAKSLMIPEDFPSDHTGESKILNGQGQLPNSKRSKSVEEVLFPILKRQKLAGGQLSQMRVPGQCQISKMSSFVGQDSMAPPRLHEVSQCKRSDPMGDVQNSVQACQFNPLNEPSPLGLSLRKSPSLLDLIQKKLSQFEDMDSERSDDMTLDCKVQTANGIHVSHAEKDKLKAANFPASMLQVGTWKCTSRYDGDLVAKCYYAKRKIVWEVLDSGLKSKMEVQWSDISAVKAIFPVGQPAVLDLELSRPPLFFREINPQPRKHTLWQSSCDFTDGQATICRHHSVEFPEGVLNRHFEKLLQCDMRLKALSEQTHAITDSLFFDNRSMHIERQHMLHYQSLLSDQSALLPLAIEEQDGDHLQRPAALHTSIESIQGPRTIDRLKREAAQHVAPIHSSVESLQGYLSEKNEPTQHAVPVHGDHTYVAPVTSSLQPDRRLDMQFSDAASPSSVIDARGLDESSSSTETEEVQLIKDALGQAPDEQRYSNVSCVNSRSFSTSKPSSFGHSSQWTSSLPLESSMKWKVDGAESSPSIQASRKQALNELSLQLLGEPICFTDEHVCTSGPVDATVSFARAQTNIGPPVQTASPSFVDVCGDLVHNHGRQVESYQHGFLCGNESKLYPRSGESNGTSVLENRVNSSFETNSSTLTSHGSCIDLLYMPRIASLPQFFEHAP